MLKICYLVTKIGVDTAENELFQISYSYPAELADLREADRERGVVVLRQRERRAAGARVYEVQQAVRLHHHRRGLAVRSVLSQAGMFNTVGERPYQSYLIQTQIYLKIMSGISKILSDLVPDLSEIFKFETIETLSKRFDEIW